VLRRHLIRATFLALAVALWSPAGAHATGLFNISGSTLQYLAAAGDIDQIAIYETPTFYRFVTFGGAQIGDGPGCFLVSAAPNTVDCIKTGVTEANLFLGDGNDIAVVSPSVKIPVTINGEAGNDGLFGGGGQDTFNGGIGDDNIIARDGLPEAVNCGDGHDTAITDDPDIRVSCEEIEGDADSDGVRRPADCDDTNPLIRPGITDAFDNGVDENCDGVDAINSDRDGDGSPRPQDCDDSNKAVHPGAKEVIGNNVDENCDTIIEPFPPLTGSVSGTWSRVGHMTENLTLVAKGFRKGTKITLRCLGSSSCPKGTKRSTVRNASKAVNLHVLLGRKALAKGARIELSLTASKRIGRLLRYRLNTPGSPDVAFLCVKPKVKPGPC
jgi:putative metal-binding protein